MDLRDLDDFRESLRRTNPELENFLEFMEKTNRSTRRKLIDDEKETRSYAERRDKIDKWVQSIKLMDTNGQRLGRKMFDLTNSSEDFIAGLEQLEKAIESTTDEAEKADLQAKKIHAEEKLRHLEYNKSLIKLTNTITGTVISGLATATKDFITGLQGNTNDTRLVGGALSSLVGIMGASGTALGGAAQSAGRAMGDFGRSPRWRAIGRGLELLGIGIEKVVPKMTALGQFALNFLIAETEKTIKGFQDLSKAGAMFSDGMTGMRIAANRAGLTVEQFAAVVGANAEAIAGTGLSVSGGVEKLGSVTAEFTKTVGASGLSLRREMQNLGYSFEEQAQLAAEVMGDLRRSRGLQNFSDQQVAEQTAEYAKNLRMISNLTGEDAKKKLEAIRAQSNEVAFRLKLQELEKRQPGITSQVLQGLSTLDESGQLAVKQLLTMGTVIDRGANVMMSGSTAYQNKVMGMARLIESGNFNLAEAQAMQGKYNDAFNQDLSNFREIGVAKLAGQLGDINKALESQVSNTDRVTEASAAAARRATEGQRDTRDPVTAKLLAASDAIQQMKVSLQEIALTALPNFSKAVKNVTDFINGIAKKAQGTDLSTFQEITGKIIQYGSTALGATIGALVAAPTGPAAIGGAVGGGMIGAEAGAAISKFLGLSPNEGYARGGISRGSKDGRLEILHGDEAVIPLPDNKKVPVSLDFANIPKTGDQTDQQSLANFYKESTNGILGAIRSMTDQIVNLTMPQSRQSGQTTQDQTQEVSSITSGLKTDFARSLLDLDRSIDRISVLFSRADSLPDIMGKVQSLDKFLSEVFGSVKYDEFRLGVKEFFTEAGVATKKLLDQGVESIASVPAKIRAVGADIADVGGRVLKGIGTTFDVAGSTITSTVGDIFTNLSRRYTADSAAIRTTATGFLSAADNTVRDISASASTSLETITSQSQDRQLDAGSDSFFEGFKRIFDVGVTKPIVDLQAANKISLDSSLTRAEELSVTPIVPLDTDLKVPVSFDVKKLSEALKLTQASVAEDAAREVSDVTAVEPVSDNSERLLAQTVDLMKSQIAKMQEMIDVLSESKDFHQQIANNSY